MTTRMRGIVKMVTTQVNVKHTCKTQCTLFQVTLQKCCASFAHRVRRVLQSVDALEPSVFVPRLQIRLAQFDSGSRLQISLLKSTI